MNLINEERKASKEYYIEIEPIDFNNEFDHLLWYYHKD